MVRFYNKDSRDTRTGRYVSVPSWKYVNVSDIMKYINAQRVERRTKEMPNSRPLGLPDPVNEKMKEAYAKSKRAAYEKRRLEYLNRYSRKVFERDHWVCASCNTKIKTKSNARAYNLAFKCNGASDMSPFITLCHKCYDETVKKYDTIFCSCVRKDPRWIAPRVRSLARKVDLTCGLCMIPPTLEERIRLKLGEGMARWVNLEL